MKKIRNVLTWMMLSILLAYGGLIFGKFISFFATAPLLLLKGSLETVIFLPSYRNVITDNLSFLGIIILVVIISKIVDKNIPKIRDSMKIRCTKYLSGVFISILMMVGLLTILLITDTIELGTEVKWKPVGILLVLISFMIQAYAEEYLFRGLILERIRRTNGMIVSILCTNIMFALLHAMNPGMSIISVCNIVLFGILFSIITWKTGSITVASGVHMGWNFCNEMVLGLPNSGLICRDAIFPCQISRESIWFHKVNGAEGGIAVTIILCITFGFMVMLMKSQTNPK